MMIALVGAVLLMDRQLAGSISSMVLFLFPLPMVFYAAKHGLRNSGAVLAALLALTFMLGTPQSIFFVAAESIIGTVYGAGVHNKTENRKILLRTLVMAALVELLAMVVFASFFGYDMAAEIEEYTKIMSSLSANTGTQLPAAFLNQNSLKTLFAMAAILTGLMEGMITHLVSRLMLKRLRFSLPPSVPLADYYPAKWSGYAALAAMVLYYWSMSRPFESEVIQTAVQALGTGGMMYLVVYGVIGIAVLLPRINPGMAKWVILIVFVLLLVFSLSLAVIGFLYITADIHKQVCEGGRYASENQ